MYGSFVSPHNGSIGVLVALDCIRYVAKACDFICVLHQDWVSKGSIDLLCGCQVQISLFDGAHRGDRLNLQARRHKQKDYTAQGQSISDRCQVVSLLVRCQVLFQKSSHALFLPEKEGID